MIEINLLPPEYRTRDKTNFPLMATLLVGFVAVGSVLVWGLSLRGEVNKLKGEVETLTVRRDELKKQEKKVDEIVREIQRQRSRQDTIIEISQSKIMWSQKLAQFSNIMRLFDNFWIDSLTLTRASRGGGGLAMNVSALGTNLRDVARFRDSIKQDPNFYYHFNDLKSDTVRITQAGKGGEEKMVFRVQLPLGQEGLSKKK